jgi:hypothetical protein
LPAKRRSGNRAFAAFLFDYPGGHWPDMGAILFIKPNDIVRHDEPSWMGTLNEAAWRTAFDIRK